MATCLIGLGSNLGDREQQLTRALELLGALPQVDLQRTSHFRATRPAGGPQGQGSFLNAVAVLETSLSPPALLLALQCIENDLGRVRTVRWGERMVDLDLLLYDRLELSTPTLELPHPRMSFRRFVLEPAAEIAPGMIYPINGWTIAQLLANLNRPEKYIALAWKLADLICAAGSLPDVRILRSAESLKIDLDAAAHDMQVAREGLLDQLYEIAAAQARLIDQAHWPASQGWTISEFWFQENELQAGLFAKSGACDFARFVERLHALQSRIVIPQLIVLPDLAADRQFAGIESMAVAIDKLKRRPETGPVLLLPANDPLRCRDEVLAAMQAME